MRTETVTWQSTLSAHAAHTAEGLPTVLIDGLTAGPIGISVDDARVLTANLITALASLGDELAQEIGDAYLCCQTCRGSGQILDVATGRWSACQDCCEGGGAP